MQLKFRHQKFQADAASAVCDVFAGQPYDRPTYRIDRGQTGQMEQTAFEDEADFTGFRNRPVVPELTDARILARINQIQRVYQIAPSPKLEGRYNLTVEMETGVGKTYTYIKTMFELNKRYGWSKYIVVVPSVAIREGVYKSFQITQDHFAAEYGKKIRYFIYNSAQLTALDRFAGDSAIHVMIINSQAFNARSKGARRIYMKLDGFRSRRPIDVVAATNPILIIDEPQSVEGAVTRERLKEFRPLFTLRYSATHKKDSLYNMVYRLDAMEAYNKKLVKKIAVKGISVAGTTATNGYLYLEGVNLSRDQPPTATLEFEIKGANAVRKTTRRVSEGYNLYERSGGLEEYSGFVVASVSGLTNSVAFTNGVILSAGEVTGLTDESQLRRIQIRETILSHLEREQELYFKGIKVLSLFFIDEVARYKRYDAAGNELNGEYADIFEEEYRNILNGRRPRFEEAYLKYLDGIPAERTHAGYFSIDKKSHRMVDSRMSDKKEKTSDDSDAYDLIMRNKERLLDLNEPVRFIFSHSALREGWDNPNVFQICTLKQSGSETRKRQEVGRGLRLCVNQAGERMDADMLGEDVHKLNLLTVVANESYESFTKALQTELAEVVAGRPREVTEALFENKAVTMPDGGRRTIDHHTAIKICHFLIRNGYLNDDNTLADRYCEDAQAGAVRLPEELKDFAPAIVQILGNLYSPQRLMPENARGYNVEAKLDADKLNSRSFRELWSRISTKSAYTVDFDTDELVAKAIGALDDELRVANVFFKVETGEMREIKSKEELAGAQSFRRNETGAAPAHAAANSGVRVDLVGKMVDETGLTRSTVVRILKGIRPATFAAFTRNPEDFIIKAGGIINEQKAAVIIGHIAYTKLDERYSTDIFTRRTLRGRLGVNAAESKRGLYDYVIYDSANEREFAKDMDDSREVALYVKLPSSFFISTPVGKYHPDWAVAFREDFASHLYLVAETKGTLSSMEQRKIEALKIACAKEHFRKISTGSVLYDVVSGYDDLLNLATK